MIIRSIFRARRRREGGNTAISVATSVTFRGRGSNLLNGVRSKSNKSLISTLNPTAIRANTSRDGSFAPLSTALMNSLLILHFSASAACVRPLASEIHKSFAPASLPNRSFRSLVDSTLGGMADFPKELWERCCIIPYLWIQYCRGGPRFEIRRN